MTNHKGMQPDKPQAPLCSNGSRAAAMSTQYLHLVPGSNLPSFPQTTPFRAVLIVEEQVTPTWMSAVTDWLVQSVCLCVMAWGKDCRSWIDSVEQAHSKKFERPDVRSDQFVMTTSHANDPLGVVFWFSKTCANHPSYDLGISLLVHISSHSNGDELLRAYADE